MKRSGTDQPFLSWCMICRGDEAKYPGVLERCLQSLRERTPNAEIVIVDTMSPDDRTVEVCQKYADVWEQWKGPNGTWTKEMAAFDNAAAARQHAFELASGVWRGWIDADDQLATPEAVRRLLDLNGQFLDVPKGAKSVGSADGPPIGLEEYIEMICKAAPETSYFTAPYLYKIQLEENSVIPAAQLFVKRVRDLPALPPVEEWPYSVGIAEVWQNGRERIVKWGDGKQWVWREAGHEVLVPADPKWNERPVHLPGLLFVHRKKFTPEDDRYSVERHFKILYDQFLKGERNTRNLLYLANFSRLICPNLERQFLSEAHRSAVLPLERMRALIEVGNFAVRSQLYYDAKEAFGSAIQFRPDLPDAWTAGAEAAMEFEDWIWASEWYREAMNRKVALDSLINPREHVLRTPLRCAQALSQIAKIQVKQGLHLQAEANLGGAAPLVANAALHPACGPDSREMTSHAIIVEQEVSAQRVAREMYSLFRFLVVNDESVKAVDLLRSIPYTLQDHPLILQMEEWAIPVRKHLTDERGYRTFYEDIGTTTDAVPSPESWFTNSPFQRVRMIVDFLQEKYPAEGSSIPIEVLEIGSYDGILGIPILRDCPNVYYTAVDASAIPLERFRTEALRLVPDGLARLKTKIGTDVTEAQMIDVTNGTPIKTYDVVIFCEVLEHVQDPVASLKRLISLVRPGGKLFVSTPWGAYDRGCPSPLHNDRPRDPRGHVRAMTVRDMVNSLALAGIRPDEIYRDDGCFGIGITMHVHARKVRSMERKPTAFVVRGSLWDWNSRSVEDNGIGASEEMIIQLGERVAMNRSTAVFGPTPEPDVHRGVGYFRHEQLRHIDPETKIVVSRAPGYASEVDRLARKKLSKVLWLQDAHYGDLNEKTAADYEKIVVVSDWHKQIMHENHGVPLDQMTVIYNWILREHFVIDDRPAREPHHFIYASSPDRGLITLLCLWPGILAIYPDATLDIFYGWRGCSKLGMGDADWIKRFTGMREAYEQLRWQPGVRERGMVNHKQIAKEFMRASALLYPSAFTETCCTTAFKSRAAGCVIVTSPLAALKETAACPETRFVSMDGLETISEDYKQRFLDAVVMAVETPHDVREMMAEEAIRDHSIERRLPLWSEVLDG